MYFSRCGCALLISTFLLAGCATTPTPHLSGRHLLPDQGVFQQLDNRKYRKSVVVGSVTSTIDPTIIAMTDGVYLLNQESLKETLEMALAKSGLAGGQTANYVLNAELQDIDKPIIGFDLTVKSSIKYTIRKKTSGKTTYNETLTLLCTVRFIESFNADERLNRAIVCSVKENVAHFMRVINR